MGLENIVGQLLLRCDPTVVNLLRGRHGSALASASYGGHEAVVRLLLKNGADVDLVEDEENYFSSALACASLGRQEAIVRLLLENGADVNLVGEGDLGSPLEHASYSGCEPIV